MLHSRNLSLDQILTLVSKLDDSEGDTTPRKRFRDFLQKHVKDVVPQQATLRLVFIANQGAQGIRVVQDLVTKFLGFDVTFGNHAGIEDHIGFDGCWQSPAGGVLE